MLRERVLRKKLNFFVPEGDWAPILVASARPGHSRASFLASQGLLGNTSGAPGACRVRPETLPRRRLDAPGRRGASRESHGTNFDSILDAPGPLPEPILLRCCCRSRYTWRWCDAEGTTLSALLQLYWVTMAASLQPQRLERDASCVARQAGSRRPRPTMGARCSESSGMMSKYAGTWGTMLLVQRVLLQRRLEHDAPGVIRAATSRRPRPTTGARRSDTSGTMPVPRRGARSTTLLAVAR